MKGRLLYVDNESMARIIDGVAVPADSVIAAKIAQDKSLSEIFFVATKALYLKANIGHYDTK